MAYGETNGYLTATAAARHRLGLPMIGKIVLYSGRFTPEHPVDLLVDAAPGVMERVKLVHFVLAGDGPTRRSVEAIVRARFLDAAIIFAGEVPAEQLGDYYTACDLGVTVSSSFGCRARGFTLDDLWPFMSAGKAIVTASDVTDARMFVQTNNVGCAVALAGRRPEEAQALQMAILSLLSDDRSRIRRGENARALSKAMGQGQGALGFLKASLRRAAAL